VGRPDRSMGPALGVDNIIGIDPISNTAGWGEWRPFDTRKTTLLHRLW
jgi:hypothetical protein